MACSFYTVLSLIPTSALANGRPASNRNGRDTNPNYHMTSSHCYVIIYAGKPRNSAYRTRPLFPPRGGWGLGTRLPHFYKLLADYISRHQSNTRLFSQVKWKALRCSKPLVRCVHKTYIVYTAYMHAWFVLSLLLLSMLASFWRSFAGLLQLIPLKVILHYLTVTLACVS